MDHSQCNKVRRLPYGVLESQVRLAVDHQKLQYTRNSSHQNSAPLTTILQGRPSLSGQEGRKVPTTVHRNTQRLNSPPAVCSEQSATPKPFTTVSQSPSITIPTSAAVTNGRELNTLDQKPCSGKTDMECPPSPATAHHGIQALEAAVLDEQTGQTSNIASLYNLISTIDMVQGPHEPIDSDVHQCVPAVANVAFSWASRELAQVCTTETGVQQANLSTLLQQAPLESDQIDSHQALATEQSRDPKIQEIVEFIQHGRLPLNETTARKLILQQSLFAILDGILYFLDPKRRNSK